MHKKLIPLAIAGLLLLLTSCSAESTAPLRNEGDTPASPPMQESAASTHPRPTPTESPSPTPSQAPPTPHENAGEAASKASLSQPIPLSPEAALEALNAIAAASPEDFDSSLPASEDPWQAAANQYLADIGIENPDLGRAAGFNLLQSQPDEQGVEYAVIYEEFDGDGLLFQKEPGGDWLLTKTVTVPAGCYGISEIGLEQSTLNGEELLWLNVLYDTNCGTSPEYTRVLIDVKNWETVFSYVEWQRENLGFADSYVSSETHWTSTGGQLIVRIDYSYEEALYSPGFLYDEGELASWTEEEIDDFAVSMKGERQAQLYFDDASGRFVLDEENTDPFTPCMWTHTADSTYTAFDRPLSNPKEYFTPELEAMLEEPGHNQVFAAFLLG